MLSHCLHITDENSRFSKITDEDEVVLLVNNPGGVSPLELSGITNEVIEQLAEKFKITPVRILVGTYMTSLNGMGFSISLLKLEDIRAMETTMLELLDAPAEANGWTAAISPKTGKDRERLSKTKRRSRKRKSGGVI